MGVYEEDDVVEQMSILWTVVDEVLPRPWSSPSPLSMIPMPCKAEIYMQEKKIYWNSHLSCLVGLFVFLFAKVTKHLLLMIWKHWMLIKKNIHKQQMLHCIKALSALVVIIANQADVVKALSAHVMHKEKHMAALGAHGMKAIMLSPM